MYQVPILCEIYGGIEVCQILSVDVQLQVCVKASTEPMEGFVVARWDTCDGKVGKNATKIINVAVEVRTALLQRDELHSKSNRVSLGAKLSNE